MKSRAMILNVKQGHHRCPQEVVWAVSSDSRFAAKVNMQCSPSMLGVGELKPKLRALEPRFISLATILHLTRSSLLYADTHLHVITLALGYFCFKFWTWASVMHSPVEQLFKLRISSSIPRNPNLGSKFASVVSSMISSGLQSNTVAPPSSMVLL